jgi:prophage regulatory protein
MNETKALEPAERLLTVPEVLRRCNIGRDLFYQLRRDGEFPDPIRLGHRSVFWKESVVEGWIDGLSSDNNKPLANPPPPGRRSRRGRRIAER